jgi:hypothetical protein
MERFIREKWENNECRVPRNYSDVPIWTSVPEVRETWSRAFPASKSIIKFSWQPADLWLKSGKNQRFENRLRSHPKGTDECLAGRPREFCYTLIFVER